VSAANDSETGRFRRTSEARGEKNSHLRHHEGVEAESSASRGRKVSAANDSMKYPKRR